MFLKLKVEIQPYRSMSHSDAISLPRAKPPANRHCLGTRLTVMTVMSQKTTWLYHMTFRLGHMTNRLVPPHFFSRTLLGETFAWTTRRFRDELSLKSTARRKFFYSTCNSYMLRAFFSCSSKAKEEEKPKYQNNLPTKALCLLKLK